MSAVRSSQSETGVPSQETMRSPGSRPAAAAGLGSSCGLQSGGVAEEVTHGGMLASWLLGTAVPKPVRMIANSTVEMNRITTGPPNSTARQRGMDSGESGLVPYAGRSASTQAG